MVLPSITFFNGKVEIYWFFLFSPSLFSAIHLCCLENISSVIFRFNCSVAEFRNCVDILVFCTKKCSVVDEENSCETCMSRGADLM